MSTATTADRVLPERRYTLVLGAGGMKGLAHIGVLAALEEHELLPDELVGCSVGALVAAAWCAGMPASELAAIAIELRRRDLFRLAHTDMAVRRLQSPALFRREPLYAFISGLIGDVTFDELQRPLLVNTVELNSGRQVFWGSPGLTDVPVADAVFASCALPGYLPPQPIRDGQYVDGATVSNLPVRIAAARGRDLVIAVDVGTGQVAPHDRRERGFAAVYARATQIAIQTMRTAILRNWRRPPLVLLQPDVSHVPLLSFEHNEELIQAGYASTTATLQRPGDLPAPDDWGIYPRRRVTLRVDRERCIGCTACLVHAPPGLFEMDGDKAVVTQRHQVWSPIDGAFLLHCPTNAIVAEESGSDA